MKKCQAFQAHSKHSHELLPWQLLHEDSVVVLLVTYITFSYLYGNTDKDQYYKNWKG